MKQSSFIIYLLFFPLFLACSLGDVVGVDDPEGFYQNIDRDVVETKEGAMSFYHSSHASFRKAFSDLSREIGIFTDELFPFEGTPSNGGTGDANQFGLDSRTLLKMDENGNMELRFQGYGEINSARIGFAHARSLLQKYGDFSTRSLVANSYALEAYTILFLAENGCSGIPLTYVPFDGAVKYTPGYSTQDLLLTAVSLLDSALAIEHDSAHFKTLARVGKGRALLSLGRFNDALNAVNGINESWPDYSLAYSEAFTPGTEHIASAFWTYTETVSSGFTLPLPEVLYVEEYDSVRAGINWIASENEVQDPRVPIEVTNHDPARYRQRKFVGGRQTVRLAGWVDAKLIESEALLNSNGLSGNEWLAPLNAARNSIGLSDTTDPGDPDSRVNLLFRERAYWNYLHGTKLGDMRRLVRLYDRMPISVFAMGDYGKGNIPFYGNNFVLSPPVEEIRYNDKYEGCDHVNP